MGLFPFGICKSEQISRCAAKGIVLWGHCKNFAMNYAVSKSNAAGKVSLFEQRISVASLDIFPARLYMIC